MNVKPGAGSGNTRMEKALAQFGTLQRLTAKALALLAPARPRQAELA
jgi:hypothetical protein